MIFLGDKIRTNIMVSCDHGTFIVNRFDYTIKESGEKVGQGQWLLDHGNVSTPEAQMTANAIGENPEPVILDIGANIGTYTSWISKFFPNGIIHAFEPQRSVFQILCGNMAINNFDNVFTHNIAIGDTNCIIEFIEPDYTKELNYGGFSLAFDVVEHKSKYRSVIDCLTVDTFVEKHKLHRVDFMKVDVEGMDLQVLRGAIETIKRFKPKMLIEYFDGVRSSEKELVDFLNEYGYSIIERDRNNLLVG